MADLKAFTLPKMGESITEGTILNWIVKEGESFEEGDILVEVGTDKVDNEVPAPSSGVLVEIKYQPNDVVKIGETIATFEETFSNSLQSKSEAKSTDKIPISQNKIPKSSTVQPQSKPSAPLAWKSSNRQNNFYSPLVESIAKKYHISYEELARIPASGSKDRLRKSDIFKYIEEGRPAQFAQPALQESHGFKVPDLKFDIGEGKIVPMDRMRQMIADHMVYSKHVSPHVTAYVEADLTNMVRWRKANKETFLEKTGQKLSFTPLFIQAVTRALKEFPKINSSLDGQNIVVKEDINIGMATALPSGNLIVPVIRNTDQKNLESLAKEVNQLAEKARNNNLTSDETKGSTFTISNVGTFGSLMGTPIINQPEAAILATGIIKKRAEVIETETGDNIEIRSMMYLSLSFDHRIVDGFLAGSFLRRIADHMESY